MDRRENVLVFGPSDTGKTHRVCALGRERIFQRRRGIFYRCSLLVQELLWATFLKRLSRFEALIIDDIGYVPQMEGLLQLPSQRYERGSVLRTSHLAFSPWDRIFKDPMTTAAAIDRRVHHCVRQVS